MKHILVTEIRNRVHKIWLETRPLRWKEHKWQISLLGYMNPVIITKDDV